MLFCFKSCVDNDIIFFVGGNQDSYPFFLGMRLICCVIPGLSGYGKDQQIEYVDCQVDKKDQKQNLDNR